MPYKNFTHIVGIDLSFTATGYAILDINSMRVSHGTFVPERVKQAKGSPKKEPTVFDDLDRVEWIRRQIAEETMKVKEPLVVLEDFAFARANMAHQLGGLAYVVRLSLYKRNLPFILVAPGRLKKFVSGKRIPDGKSRAARRTLKLTAASAALLEFRKAESRSGWMFPALRAAGPMTSMQDSHDAACERSGCSFVLYDLRHTFATRAALTMPITTLAAVLGHGNLRSVMKYIHPQAADIAAGMDAFEAATVVVEKDRRNDRRSL